MAPVAAIIIDPAMVFPSIVQFLLLGKIIVRATKREQSEELPILWFAHVYHSPCVEMMREEKYGKIKEESWDQVNKASNAVHSACDLPAVRLLCGWSHVTLGIAAPRVKQTVLISQVLFLKTKTELGGGTRTIWPFPTNLHIQNLEVGGVQCRIVPASPHPDFSFLLQFPSTLTWSIKFLFDIFPLTEQFLNEKFCLKY